MMIMGVDHQVILDIYNKEIRTILEYGAVVFHSGLTKKLSNLIENIQKLVLNLVSNYLGLKLTYSEQTIYFSVEKLLYRRLDLCSNFVKNHIRSKNNYLFNVHNSNHNTRGSTVKVREFKCNTSRFYKSPLVFLTRLANKLNIQVK